jgi:hypothetical protein
MAQEKNILIQVSDDGATWTDLITLSKGTVSYRNEGLTLATTKYYRTIAKGDGVNTLDSDPSAAVSVASGFVQRYQDVLDKATTDGVGHPSFTQNLINDLIVRNLIQEGYLHESDKTQDELVYLYYGEQEAGTPYEFITYNWVDPTKHRLTNLGANNVDFTAGQGFSVTGGNDQYFNMNFVPSTDHVRGGANNSAVVFKLFNVPTTYVNPIRIIGVEGGTYDTNILQSSNGALTTRFYEDGRNSPSTITQSEINSHWQITKFDNSKNQRIFKNGSFLKTSDATTGWSSNGLPTDSIHMFGYNGGGGTHYPSEGGFGIGYLAKGTAMLYMDNLLYRILNKTYTFKESAPAGVSRLTVATSVLPSLYMPHVRRADDFPDGLITGLTKKYIIIYSTDHAGYGDGLDGGIAWGQADYPNLSDFEDMGIILQNTNDPETPHLEYVPNDPDGKPLHLYFHTGLDDTRNGSGNQQTWLWKTAGGSLTNPSIWTEVQHPLGLRSDLGVTENHTGYLVTFLQDDGSWIGVHSTRNWQANTISGIPKIGISTAPSSGTPWTRQTSEIEITSFMPYYHQFHHSRYLFFTRNTIQYCAGSFAQLDFDFDKSRICICQCDGNYNPTTFLGNISDVDSGNGATNCSFYIDEVNAPDTLNIYYTIGRTTLYHTTWDLKNLD